MGKPKLSDVMGKPRKIPVIKTVINSGSGAHIQIYKTEKNNRMAHQVIVAWMNNNQDQGLAYQSVHKCKLQTARNMSSKLFKKPETVKAVAAYLYGNIPKEERPGKDAAITLLDGWIHNNLLDYYGDSWSSLKSPKEMRDELPKEVQIAITEVNVTETTRTQEDGTEVMQRNVKFKTIEKLKALETKGKIQRWITTMELRITHALDAETMMLASARRIKLLAVDDKIIQGESVRVEK